MMRPRFESEQARIGADSSILGSVLDLGNFNALALLNKLEPLTGFSKLQNPESQNTRVVNLVQ